MDRPPPDPAVMEDDEETYGSVLRNFLETTSSHGLPRIASERSKYRKIFWALVFTGAAIYFLFQLAGLVETYSKFPVAVNTLIRRRHVVPFPAVTVCNINMLKKNQTKEYDFFKELVTIDEKYDVIQRETDTEYDDTDVGAAADDDPVDYYDEYADLYDDGSLTIAEPTFDVKTDNDFMGFLKGSKTPDFSDLVDILRPSENELELLGEQQETFIVSCSFDKRNCSERDIKKIFNSYYGTCFTFNSGNNGYVNKTSKFGSRYGLRMMLNLRIDDYIGFFSPEKGVRVAIHPQNITPFPQDDGISAAPGMKTNVGTHLTEVERLKHPYGSNCTNGQEYKLNYAGNYTDFACGLSCLENAVGKKCNCSVRPSVDATDTSLCSFANKKQVACQTHIYEQYSHGNLSCDCPPSCSEQKYVSSVSISSWPTLNYINLLRDLRDIPAFDDLPNKEEDLINYIATNLVSIHVYLDDKSVAIIEETPSYQWSRLVADIGGLLGLFVGISMCTGVEFLELLLDLIILGCRRMKNKNKTYSGGVAERDVKA